MACAYLPDAPIAVALDDGALGAETRSGSGFRARFS
jgi:hypothetical protein